MHIQQPDHTYDDTVLVLKILAAKHGITLRVVVEIVAERAGEGEE
jgi:hypothetical protein